MELFFDTETSNKFNFKTAKYTDSDFPWVVQLGAVLAEDDIAYSEINVIIQPEGRSITEGAQRVHNISIETAEKTGIFENSIISVFQKLMNNAETLVAHNFAFDSQLMAAMFHRNGEKQVAKQLVEEIPYFCTMKGSTSLCKLPGVYSWKWPKLSELYTFLFKEQMVGAHDAFYDIKATMRCYYELRRKGYARYKRKLS